MEAHTLKNILTGVFAALLQHHDRQYEEAAFLQKYVSHNERTSKSEFELGDDEGLVSGDTPRLHGGADGCA